MYLIFRLVGESVGRNVGEKTQFYLFCYHINLDTLRKAAGSMFGHFRQVSLDKFYHKGGISVEIHSKTQV